ncbi:MAG: PAS domain S-box protein [Elusimicrobiota bacterium]|jgi:PAS domain S-box-containing protein
MLDTAKVPPQFLKLFEAAQEQVASYFEDRRFDPTHGSITIAGERYILVRANSMSVGFFDAIREMYKESGQAQATAMARQFLYDLAHSLGMQDARNFHRKMGLQDPVAKLSAGPIHFAHSGWAFVDISPESRPTPDKDFFLLYDHPYSFESDSWLKAARRSESPACIMNSGYSAGWCEASFGVPLVAAEIMCKAHGDEACRFIMAHPDHIAEHLQRHAAAHPGISPKLAYQIPGLFHRKDLEELMSQERDRAQQYLDVARVIMLALDQHGQVTLINRKGCEVLGYSEDEVLGKDWVDNFIPPRSRDKIRELAQQIISGETIYKERHENPILTKNGQERIIEWHNSQIRDAAGGIAGTISSGLDVTERRLAEDKLRESELRFRQVLDAANDWIWEVDENGTYTFVSPRVRDILGYEPQELIGKTPFDFMTQPEAERVSAAFKDIAAARKPFRGLENVNIHKDGHEVVLETNGLPIIDAAGRFQGYRGLDRDITERRNSDISLRLSREQLLQAQKLEAVGRLASGVAHDFNNIMTAVVAYSDFLIKAIPAGDPRREDAEEIKKAAGKATALTQQLLAVSRKQVFKTKILNLNAVIADVEKLLRRTLGEEIQLSTVLDSKLGAIKADPAQLGQVLLNLAVNSRDAISDAGRIFITTSNMDISEPALHRHFTLPPGKYALLSFSDNGCGMTEDTKSHLFEPFFTTKDKGKGTGLGLPTVFGIVTQSQGYISVYSMVGHGTTVKIYFPRVDALAAPMPVHEPSHAEFKGSETILLVEDDISVRMVARRILGNCGYSVLEAGSGEEALRVSAAHPGCIHLMVTDVIMPVMNGLQLAKDIQPKRPDMRILFMSGYTDELLSSKGLSPKDFNFIQKPFAPKDLARKIRELLDPKPAQ